MVPFFARGAFPGGSVGCGPRLGLPNRSGQDPQEPEIIGSYGANGGAGIRGRRGRGVGLRRTQAGPTRVARCRGAYEDRGEDLRGNGAVGRCGWGGPAPSPVSLIGLRIRRDRLVVSIRLHSWAKEILGDPRDSLRARGAA